ncbi:MAG: DUF1453 family protein [Alphaproteobacteria bacterium]|nr:DUF1453 family protein [Alphaproteobacteria bacterium]
MVQPYLPYLIALPFLALVVWRLSRAAKGRPVKPSRLWIRPAVIGLLMIAPFAASPRPDVTALAIFTAAAVAGLLLGFVLARHQEFSIDPQTGAITSRMSPVGIALFVGLIVVRMAFRVAIQGGQPPARLAAHSAQVMLYTEAALLFVFALILAQAVETWRRIKPLRAEHEVRTAAE